MPFADFIKATVVLCAGAATTLAAVAVLAAAAEHDPGALTIPFFWWALAAIVGLVLGGRGAASAGIARMLGDARAVTSVPEPRAGLILVERLWPLLVSTLIAGILGIVTPAIPGIAVGFAIVSALAWRLQYGAVLAVEGRDGVRFFVERTRFWRPITLIRTPGFRVFRPS
ncbi:MAG TPA: hypothetical protein VL977_00205 [Solirubrobacteraceae bacterium]|nr:hypothetical protein [Solirubrobacteraceae bacterium]